MSGIINNFTGYMLGNGRHAAMPGEQWWPIDTMVFVCRNIDVARAKLADSQRPGFMDSPVWTTIYRVKAPHIKYERIDNNLIWTRDASRIIVDSIVCYKQPPQISEEVLLNRARLAMPRMAKLIDSLNRRGK